MLRCYSNGSFGPNGFEQCDFARRDAIAVGKVEAKGKAGMRHGIRTPEETAFDDAPNRATKGQATEQPQKTTSWIPAATRIAAKLYRVIVCDSQRSPTVVPIRAPAKAARGAERAAVCLGDAQCSAMSIGARKAPPPTPVSILPSLGGGGLPYIQGTGQVLRSNLPI